MNTIILADDHQILRDALRLLLETQAKFHVLAECSNGLDALAQVEKYQPDVLILDLMMPGLSGIEVARGVKHVSARTKVIVLSMYDADSYVVEALRAGAVGYVLKKNSSEELIFAIRQTLAGNVYLSPALNERAIQAYMQIVDEARPEDPYETLTLREREIFQLAAEGLNNPQIAERLSISARTAEMHRGNLMKKLGLKSQTDLVKYAVKRGLV